MAKNRRNLFEVENARNLTTDEVVKTFVPPQSFWRLLSSKNHILLGSRGSGKTAMARMLSHDHLSKLSDRRAKKAIATRAFIGIYVPTRLEWVGSLKNKVWHSEQEKEAAFVWRLNIVSCIAFLRTIRSCLTVYYEDIGMRVKNERLLCGELSNAWCPEEAAYASIDDLHKRLEAIEYERQQQVARLYVTGKDQASEIPVGTTFSMELFGPLRRAANIAARLLSFPETTAWLLCLDEAEFLDEDQQVIINGHMRAYSGNLFFKIATMPYYHFTSATNASVPLDPGHDFDYVYLDRDPVLIGANTPFRDNDTNDFAQSLFKRRLAASGPSVRGGSLAKLFGSSELLDPKPSFWGKASSTMDLLRKYASDETISRADRLQGTERFSSEISRKMHGALLLRDSVERSVGHRKLNVYSGATMVMRCGDANPRRLIRIFNAMFLAATSKEIWRNTIGLRNQSRSVISSAKQTEVLLTFSDQLLASVQSEPEFGGELYEFLQMIGDYMRYQFHSLKLTTDQVSSIVLDRTTTKREWFLVQRAVSLGLLYPNATQSNPDELPVREGVFHLAYALAPHFKLLPRRGKARHLSTIRRFWDMPRGEVAKKDKLSQFWLPPFLE